MSVVIEVVERINKVHVFRPFVIQTLVPVIVFIGHTEPCCKAFVCRHVPVLVPSQAPRAAVGGIHSVVAALGHRFPHRFRSLSLDGMHCRVRITQFQLPLNFKVTDAVIKFHHTFVDTLRLVEEGSGCCLYPVVEIRQQPFAFLIVLHQLTQYYPPIVQRILDDAFLFDLFPVLVLIQDDFFQHHDARIFKRFFGVHVS